MDSRDGACRTMELEESMSRIQAKLAFISMAAGACAMLTEGDLKGLPYQTKAWEGLEWIAEEMFDEIELWQKQLT